MMTEAKPSQVYNSRHIALYFEDGDLIRSDLTQQQATTVAAALHKDYPTLVIYHQTHRDGVTCKRLNSQGLQVQPLIPFQPGDPIL